MSRPRVLNLAEGTVSLQGFPKEVADALAAHVKAFGTTATAIAEEVKAAIPLPAPTKGTPDTAIGLSQDINTRQYTLVSIAYNKDTKEAVVTKIEAINEYKRDAVTKFKTAASDLNFV